MVAMEKMADARDTITRMKEFKDRLDIIKWLDNCMKTLAGGLYEINMNDGRKVA